MANAPASAQGLWRHAHWIVLAVLLVLAAISYRYVTLEQQVGQDYFFAHDDPVYREAKRIYAIFPSQPVLLVNAATSQIRAEAYGEWIEALTEGLAARPEVLNVRSIASGPKDIEDAIESPLWKRLLVPDQFDSTNVIVVLRQNKDRDNEVFIKEIEDIVESHQRPDFELRLAGAPYVIEQIRKFLLADFKVFSLAATLIFGVIILLLFRSVKLLLGALICCGVAVLGTLVAQSLLGIPLGLLTTNTVTVVFVLTASHIVFMTFNWRHYAREGNHDDLAAAARNRTFSASFWCMVTTMLGFATLLLADAKPLRALGICGAIGTGSALVSAYALYPLYLRWTDPSGYSRFGDKLAARLSRKPLLVPALLFTAACLACVLGLPKMQTDPSLLDYFKKGSEVRERMVYADQHGGSAPLQIVVRRDNGAQMNTGDAYDRLWYAQKALENDPDVGTVVSLPVLLAEADRHPLSAFLTWEWMLDLLETERFGKVAQGFITENRKLTRFTLTMIESDREQPRKEILQRLERTLAKHGFETVLMGDAYYLQAELSSRVETSLYTGLAGLMVALAIIAFIVGRSPRVTMGLLVCLTLVPLVIIGGGALIGVPLDIISAPAANVGIGLAIDMMIHLVVAMRLARKDTDSQWAAWVIARETQWPAVAGAAVVVIAGFSIFALSQFPPTQRFGLSVAVGTFVAAVASLLVLPVIAGYKPGAARRLENENPATSG